MVSPISDEQLAYYRAVAGEYEDHAINVPGGAQLHAAIASFKPTGHVLELACGPGVWTEGLQRSAATVTAVDGAAEMLARAQERLPPDAPVQFVQADLFTWRPHRRYDAIFFGFWISHVPEERFESFWKLVDEALEPQGTVFFFDDNHRTADELIEGTASPIVRRELNDGTGFRVLKIPYQPAELEQRLRSLNWDIAVHGTDGPFYWGIGGRKGPADGPT